LTVVVTIRSCSGHWNGSLDAAVIRSIAARAPVPYSDCVLTASGYFVFLKKLLFYLYRSKSCPCV
jgi:hypothetical protein